LDARIEQDERFARFVGRRLRPLRQVRAFVVRAATGNQQNRRGSGKE
jgi:hypothetical protein